MNVYKVQDKCDLLQYHVTEQALKDSSGLHLFAQQKYADAVCDARGDAIKIECRAPKKIIKTQSKVPVNK